LCDNSFAWKKYGWAPKVGIEDGLAKVIEYESELLSRL